MRALHMDSILAVAPTCSSRWASEADEQLWVNLQVTTLDDNFPMCLPSLPLAFTLPLPIRDAWLGDRGIVRHAASKYLRRSLVRWQRPCRDEGMAKDHACQDHTALT